MVRSLVRFFFVFFSTLNKESLTNQKGGGSPGSPNPYRVPPSRDARLRTAVCTTEGIARGNDCEPDGAESRSWSFQPCLFMDTGWVKSPSNS